jgi:hypothetical protein
MIGANIYPVISNNQIYSNGDTGIECYNYDQGSNREFLPQITLNKVYDNGNWGLYLQTSDVIDVLYNDVHDNQYGIYLFDGTKG